MRAAEKQRRYVLLAVKTAPGRRIGFIIWLAPRAGKMKRIPCSDWLPERARWAHLARSGLPALVPRTKDCLERAYVVL